MLEVLKILAENLIKLISVDSISKARKEKKLNKVGTEIFLLYSELNTILVLGREIISELENGIEWMKRKVYEGEPERVYNHYITFRLKQQLINLKQFAKGYENLQYQLEAVDPNLKLNLKPIIYGKRNAIALLQLSIDSWYDNPKTKIVSIDESKLIALTENKSLKNKELQYALEEGYFGSGNVFDGLIIEEGINDTDNIQSGSYKVIENYINSGTPQKRLDEIEKIGRSLKESIEKHFSLKDIILNVGDKRLLPKKTLY